MTVSYKTQVVGTLMVLCGLYLTPVMQVHAQGAQSFITPTQPALLGATDASSAGSKALADSRDDKSEVGVAAVAANRTSSLPFCVLTSNEGTQYVETGVIHSIAFGQNGIRLKNLGQFLNLAEGRRFEVRRLKRELSLNSSMLGGVEIFCLADEFGNIYLRLPTSDDLSQMAEPT